MVAGCARMSTPGPPETGLPAPCRWFARAVFLLTVVFLALAAGALAASVFSARFRAGELPLALGAAAGYWLLSLFITGALWLAWYRRKEFLLLLASLAAACVLIEALTPYVLPERAMMRFRWQNSRRYHHLAPPNRTMFKTYYENEPILVATNEDGLRSEYSREAFLQYSERIVMMGDSFTYGYGVRQRFAFPEVCQQLLRERLHRDGLAVLNAGIVSYSPFLANLLFDGVIRAYKPQLVLYFLDATDFGDDYQYAAMAKCDEHGVYFDIDERGQFYYGVIGELVYRAFTQPPLSQALECALYPKEVVLRKVLGWPSRERKEYYDFTVRIDGVTEYNRYFIYRHPPESLRPYFAATRENIDRLAHKVRRAGAAFALVVVPRFHHYDPKESPDYWERGQYATNEPYQYAYLEYFDQVKEQADYPVLNLLSAFQAAKERPLTFRQDAHWNDRGHAFVARTIADYLVEQGLLR